MQTVLSEAEYDRAWHALVDPMPPDQQSYFLYHKRRYYELFNSLAYYTRDLATPSVLEIGVSGFTRLYKQLLPHIELVTVDRPVEMHGARPVFARSEYGAARHYNLDLNRQPLDPHWGMPPLGQFDCVVFCEILEHLTIDPAQIIHELVGLLRSAGRLYLTTPNFFSIHHLLQIKRREHPQAAFARRGEDRDAITHFREYSMAELLAATEAAGGKVVHAEYSDCWEDETTRQAIEATPTLRSNLLIVACRADAPETPDASVESVRADLGDLTEAELTQLGLGPPEVDVSDLTEGTMLKHLLRKTIVAPLWSLATHVPGGVKAWEGGLQLIGRPVPQPDPAPPAPVVVTPPPPVAPAVSSRPTLTEVAATTEVPQPTQPSRWCKVCNLPDWDDPEFNEFLDALHLPFGRQEIHRKHWEFVQALRGLKAFGYLRPDAIALGVGAGREFPVYYLTNHIRKVIASDIYGHGTFQSSDAMAEMLVTPEKHAPFPYRESHLVTQYMDGLDLKYPDNSFDFVFSFSSIEHFGGHSAATRAMQEIARVLKPDGMVAIATEVVLNGVPHAEFFLPDELYTYLVYPTGLHLVEPIDFTIAPALLAKPIDLDSDHRGIYPHIVIRQGTVVFTSVLLLLVKPSPDSHAAPL